MIPPEQLSRFEHVRDILAQPEAVERTLEALKSTAPPDVLREALAAGKIRRVVLTGMGASFHALYPLHLKLTSNGLDTFLVETSELIHYQSALLRPRTLVVAASQSGRSAETLRLLAMADRITLAGVTNNIESPLAERAQYAVILAAGAESSVSTKTYVATLTALEWLGAGLTGENTADVLESFRTALAPMRGYLKRWQEHVGWLISWLEGVNHVFLAGRGRSLATAWEGGLVLKEAAHFPAEGMGSAELRHGPLDMMRPGILVCVFAGERQTVELNRGLAADVAATGAKVAWIGPDSQQEVFHTPGAGGAALTLAEILPVQMISLALAARSGHEPGRFVRLGKVTTVE